MKKIYLLASILFLAFSTVFGQILEPGTAKAMLLKDLATLKPDVKDVNDAMVSSAYTSAEGITYVYLQQAYQNIPVYNSIYSIVLKDGRIVSQQGSFRKNFASQAAKLLNGKSVNAQNAVETAARYFNAGKPIFHRNAMPDKDGKISFGDCGIAADDITARLMWFADAQNVVHLTWQVDIALKNTPDFWSVRIDAATNKVLDKSNYTVYEQHNDVNFVEQKKINKPYSFSNGQPAAQSNGVNQAPLIVGTANYHVIAHPLESPAYGVPVTVTNPWTLAGSSNPNAVSLKWHNDGTTDYIITRGNNVFATEDRAGSNTNNGMPATSTTQPDPLNFIFPVDFNASPSSGNNQQFSITNLFYWNNIAHDLLYNYTFNEVNGNFQNSNQGRGGLGNDYVQALAQSGVAMNNANFSTPPDGTKPRMRMYLFDSVVAVVLHENTPVSTNYRAVESNMSTANKLSAVGPKTGQVVWFEDADGSHEGCSAATNSLTGKIALIKRGTCSFAIKVLAAQNAGAIAVIMINNVPGNPIIMGGTDNTITIPAVMVSDVDGAILISKLASNLNMTLSVPSVFNRDGDLDNGIITHEYGHGVSNRLTGGPAITTCLTNKEQGGEGWSDYLALMMTTNWATATPTSGTLPRNVGQYAVSSASTEPGIRNYPYSTNMSINPLTYDTMTSSTTGWGEVHNIGEIWCSALWDMTWKIIETKGINVDMFNANATGGNNIALRLVIEGMKLQKCNPGFLDARDGILAADRLLYNGQYRCAIMWAFGRRGMGFNAVQGSADNTGDQVGGYSTAEVIYRVTTSTVSVPEGQNVTYTHHVTAGPCSGVTNLTIRDTLPANVTYVSGGTYNASTREVTFTVNVAAGTTGTYSYTVKANTGSYFTPVVLLNDPVPAGATLPNTNFTASGSGWTVTTTDFKSAPSSYKANESTLTDDQSLVTTNNLALGTTPPDMVFWHKFDTESTYDGGVLEISTDNGTTWNDLGPSVTSNGYNSIFASGTALVGRGTWSGASNGWKKVTVNLAPYAGMNAKIRFRFLTDDGTGGNGWFVDDISVKKVPQIVIQSSLYNGGILVATADTLTAITEPVQSCDNVTISTQPTAQTVCGGANATFTVAATGTNPTYQWQVSTTGCGGTFTNISGATAPTLTLNNVSASMNGYAYKVIVSNSCPSTVTSSCVVLNINPASAAITTQPTDQTACVGTNATFTAAASGTGLTYQWQSSTDGGTTWNDIAGATSATYTVSVTAGTQNNNKYRLKVTSSCNTVTSNAVTLTVPTVLAITAQPAAVTTCAGVNVSFGVMATGNPTGYQWQVSTTGCSGTFTDIAGATSSTYNVTNPTSAMNGYAYRVILNNSCGSPLTSSCAVLTVNNGTLSITSQPTDQTGCIGTSVTYTGAATGTGAAYQWQLSTDNGATWTDVAGATNATLTVNVSAATQNNNKYRLKVTGTCSSTGIFSNAANLTVPVGPAITTQPSSVSKCGGAGATFTVVASGPGLTYQWQHSVNGGAFTNITGATGTTYTVNPVSTVASGTKYRVVVSGTNCTPVTSTEATLTIVSPTVNITDNGAGVLTANVNPAGTYTYQWYRNNNLINGATGTTYTVSPDSSGAYTVSITDAAGGCFAMSTAVTASGKPANWLTIGPNPTGGNLMVKYYSGTERPVARAINLFDSKGARVLSKDLGSGSSTIQTFSLNLGKLSGGTYVLELLDANGKAIASRKVVRQ